METRELCKNIEGDPAKPDLAATTCWQVFSVNGLRGRLHSLWVQRVLAVFIRPWHRLFPHHFLELFLAANQKVSAQLLSQKLSAIPFWYDHLQ